MRRAFLLTGFLWAGCPGAPPEPTPDLQPQRVLSLAAPGEYTVGGSALALALGDFNGDQLQDVAVARADSITPQVVVLLGLSGGALGQRRPFSTGDTPYAVAAADLNRDQRLDLVVANYLGQSVSVHLNPGTGMFPTHTDVPVGEHPISLAVADVNGDTRSDIIVATQVGRAISVLLGQAGGGYTKADIPLGDTPSAVAVGQVGGDPALLVLGQANLLVLRGTGGGAFALKDTYALEGQPAGLAVGDLNGDGLPDVTVANFSLGSVSVLLGQADGKLAAPQRYPTGAGPLSVAIGDMDRDGRVDLVAACAGESTVSVLLANGEGGFRPPANFPAGARPIALALGDQDGDGKLDVITVSAEKGVVDVLLNRSTP